MAHQTKGTPADGGLIRYANGEWLVGLSYHIGHYSAFNAELWGLLKGLSLAWEAGFRKVSVECDSKVIL